MASLSRLLLLVLLLCGAAAVRADAVTAPPPPAPPAAVLRALERGINLSIWFTYRGQPGVETARYTPDAADWRQITALGFRHVRVQFDPAYFRDRQRAGALSKARLTELQRALAPAWAAGLMVVLAAEPEAAEKTRLVGDTGGRAELAAFWREFAKAFKSVRPNRLAFELLNEPTLSDAASNRALMRSLVEAVRAAAPRHTLVVTGHGYSGIDELVALEPLLEPNLVYTFHFYEPHNFTHQGATWSWPLLASFKDVPYPSSPEWLAPVVAAAADEAKPHLSFYGEQRWDRARLEARLDLARDWAARHQRPLWCGEFGVARLGAPSPSRLQWLTDVHSALTARGLPWTLFDYAGHFGLVTGNAGARQLDLNEAVALGLTIPEGIRPEAQ